MYASIGDIGGKSGSNDGWLRPSVSTRVVANVYSSLTIQVRSKLGTWAEPAALVSGGDNIRRPVELFLIDRAHSAKLLCVEYKAGIADRHSGGL
jgi:hypothetical protein